MFQLTGLAIIQVVTSALSCVSVARSVPIALVTPYGHRFFADLEMCVEAVCHSPWHSRWTSLRSGAPLVLARLSIPREFALAGALLGGGDMIMNTAALMIADPTFFLWTFLHLTSVPMVPIETRALAVIIIAGAMPRACLCQFLEIQASLDIVGHLIIHTGRIAISWPISPVHVAGPDCWTPFVLASWTEEWEPALACSRDAGTITGKVYSRVCHMVGALHVALYAVPLKIANTTIIFRASFV